MPSPEIDAINANLAGIAGRLDAIENRLPAPIPPPVVPPAPVTSAFPYEAFGA